MIRNYLKSIGYIFFTVLVIIFLVSCKDESECEKNADKEKSKLNSYLANLRTQKIVNEISINGYDEKVYLYNFDSLPNDPIVYNSTDFIIIDYLGKTIDGDVYETNIDTFISQWSNYQTYNYDHFVFHPIKVPFADRIVGLKAGISFIPEGHQGDLVIPSSLAFNECEHTTVVYRIKIHRVITNILHYDTLQWKKILEADFESDTARPLISGIWFKEIESASADSLISDQADSLKITFGAYFLQEGAKIRFDTSNGSIKIPANNIETFTGKNILKFPQGFAAAFDTMRINTTAEILVPYQRGFGQSGLRHSIFDYIIVPPYTSLLYIIKLESEEL